MENSGKYERLEYEKAHPELGRALPSDSRGWHKGLLPRGYGRKTLTPTLEREQFEEVLFLIVIVVKDVLCCK